MKKLAAVLSMVAALAAPVIAGPYDTWAKYRNVTVNTTTAGVTTPQSNFPLLVRLTDANPASGSDVLADDATGASARFASSGGDTALDYEIESWSSSAAAVWVKVPVIAGSGATTIRLYWGKDTTDASNGAAVFAVANGHRAVYHLNDANGANATDATSNGYHAVPGAVGGAGNPTITAGMIGNGKNFNASGTNGNTNGSFYRVANSTAPRLNFNANGDLYTLSAWVRPDIAVTGTGTANRMGVISKYGTAAGQQYHLAYVGNGTAPVNRWSGNHKHAGGEAWQEGGATVAAWQHVVVTRSGVGTTGTANNANLYINGIISATARAGSATAGGNGTGADVTIGGYAPPDAPSNPARFFDGQIDEVRIDSTARSADYIKLSYETQRAVVTAVALGETQEQETGPTVPGAPTNVAGTAGNGQVSVTFTAPENDGGAEITSYTVTSSPGDFTGTGAASPIVVSGLANGTPYTFTVTATNSEGEGEASAPSGAVTPRTIPGAPTGVAGTPASSGQVSVSFTAPESNGGAAITNYTVTSSPGDFTGTGAASPVVVSGLANGTPYTFTVTATNAAGDGPASEPSGAVSPVAAPTVAYPGGPFTFPLGPRIQLNPVKGGGAALGYSIDPANVTALTGLQFNTVTGVLSGNPAVPLTNQLFVVTAHGAGGSTDTAHVTLSTTGPTVSYPGGPFTFPLGVVIEPVRPVKGLATITGYSIDAADFTAETGLQFNTMTGIISGAPTVALAGELFVVTAHGVGGSTDTAHVTISTTGPSVAYTGGPFTLPLGVIIEPIRPVTGPARITGYSIDGDLTALTGLQFNTNTGVLSGAPTESVTALGFEVTAHGAGGSEGTAEVVITTTGPTVSYAGTPYTLSLGVLIEPLRPVTGPARITGYSIDPPDITALTGLQFNTSTGILSGRPTVLAAALDFEVTASGLDGTEATAELVITTQGLAPTVAYPSDGEYDFALGSRITDLRPIKGGGPIVNYSIAPPDITARTRNVSGGLQFNSVTGIISGTPTKLLEGGDAEAFTVTAHGWAGTTGTFDVTINTHSTGKMNAGGPLVFRVSGSSMSYTFQVGGEAALEAVTMRIADMSGRTVWSRTVNPSQDGATGITWDGRSQSGVKAPAGMYIVHVASKADGKTTRVVRKTVTLDAD